VVDRLEPVRGVWGPCLLVEPRPVAGRLLHRTVMPRFVMVVRILGVRQRVQALRTMPPSLSGLRTLGGAVDIVRVFSMLGIATFAPRHRRAALTVPAYRARSPSSNLGLDAHN
jgi:hypothetical protein